MSGYFEYYKIIRRVKINIVSACLSKAYSLMLNRTIELANQFASNYDNYIHNCHWVGTDIMFGLMYNAIQSNQTLLDIGIGTGLSSLLFHKAGLYIYGIDGSEEMLKICANKGIAVELKQADLTKNETWFKNQKFNHVISHGLFHLIGDIKGIFKQISTILTNNGLFGFTYEPLSRLDDGYSELPISGIYERRNKESDISVYRHTYEYISSLLLENKLYPIKEVEFIAFIDEATNTKTLFKLIVSQKQLE